MATGIPTQDFIPIESIRDGIVLLKNGEYRAILITSSINLSLKSSDEQGAIYLQFQNLLNGLDFPLQIFAQSRRLDIKPYIKLLEKRRGEVKEDLLKVQIAEYIDFVQRFTDESNIMTKHFFIVVPYAPLMPQSSNKNTALDEAFEQIKIQMGQRVNVIMSGLNRFGVRSSMLTTEQAIELFYKEFNPGEQGSISGIAK